ncbi:lectin 3a [Fomitopsis serialis]|uniref:lectin 3a n=1 Tax=Fomitopsis serialis TaxID=139415 RepID=UPI002008790C|nr:lectin 3a [Neoantrodia serialis]KAH9924525.1 lectin 3a [Neoantrodia serialis]
MTYTIHVRIINASPKDFAVVEQTVWYYADGGVWTYADDIRTLTMNGSGTSGVLRFRGSDGEEFLVPLGVHNYKRWCDIVPDLAPGDTAMKVQPEYYNSGARGEMLWKQLEEISKKSAKGTQIDVKYTSEKDTVFTVHITIA